MRLYLIRHGLTQGNQRRAYIGAGTDEPLCDEGKAQLLSREYPHVDLVFASPMKRCKMTAECIYPNQETVVCDGLKEMDFGDFEGKTYEELKDCPAYLRWLGQNGEGAFPNGESKQMFTRRILGAFRECIIYLRQRQVQTAALVVHGGTIMAIMEEYGTPKGAYYRWQVINGEFVELTIDIEKF